MKVDKPAKDVDSEKTISESLHQTSEAAMDPPPEEHHVFMDSMDVNLAHAKSPNPSQSAQETKDVIIRGLTDTTPDNHPVLTTHIEQ